MLGVEHRLVQEPDFRISKRKGIEEVFQNQLILCSPVKNKVLLVNREIDTGLDLWEGKESSVGLFVRSAFPELITKKSGDQLLERWPGHDRTTLYTRKKIKDIQERSHRDIDLKGNGYTRDGKVKLPGGDTGQGLFGLLEKKKAYEEYKMSEKFLAAGIRTPRIVAIIGLEEIIYEGRKVSLERARDKGIIRPDFQPVILVRAFGTRARPRDISENIGLNKETQKIIFEDAKELVGEELGRGKVNYLTNLEYLYWFMGTLGENVGKVHRKGWLHGLLSSHNTTLDVRLCDLDTVERIKNDREREWELNFTINHSIQSMAKALNLSESCFNIAAHIFKKNYYDAYYGGERRYSW